MDPTGKKERDLFTVKKAKPTKQGGKRKKRQNENDGEKETKSKKKKTTGNISSTIEPLSYQSLMSGLVTLGCISEVTNYDLIVSLPHMLFGRVPITRISQAYTNLLKKVTEAKEESDDAEDQVFTLKSLFKKGQYVITKVESVEKTETLHKVSLCLMPQEVNFGVSVSKLYAGAVLPCAVASIEDNGYVMETGIPNVRVAFLNREKAEGSGIVGVGSVVRCRVTKVQRSDDGVSAQLKLTAIPKEVNKATIDIADTNDFSMLLPGTAFVTAVAEIEKDCMKLIMAEDDGFVSPYHLQTSWHQLQSYQISQNVKARVLYITPLSRVVHLTLQQSLFSESPVEDLLHGFNLGDRKEGVVYEVVRRGVFFKLGDCRAFCSRKRLRDKAKENEDDHFDFPIGSEHALRILSYHYFDQIFTVSLQKSILSDQIVGFNAVKVGEVLKATIKSYDSQKAIVSVGTNVDGEIPLLHLTDTTVPHPEKKYPIGQTVNVRALEVIPERKHLVLTCKRLLVDSKEPIILDYNKDLENTVARGFIAKIYPMGLLVAFYGGVKGFVPKSEASTEQVDDLSKMFAVGNVVKCRILSVKPEEKKMILSLVLNKKNLETKTISNAEKVNKKNLETKTISNAEKVNKKNLETKTISNAKKVNKKNLETKTISNAKKVTKELNIRTIVNCKVKKVDKDSVKVRIRPSNIKAEIPIPHLADDMSRCKALKGILCNGDLIHNLTVFSKIDTITLSMKDSVCRWVMKSKPECQEHLVEGSTYPGVVSEILPSGYMVSIPLGTSGYSALIQSIPSEEGESIGKDFTNVNMAVGQSVEVKCMGFGKRDCPILSAICTNPRMDKHNHLQLLYNHLKYESLLQTDLVRKGLLSKEFGDLQIGNKMEVEVVAVTSLGLLVKSENGGISGIIVSEHLPPDTKYKVGSRVEVSVLHVHIQEKCVVFTAKTDLVEQLHVEENPQIKLEQHVKGEVLFIQKEFILLRLKTQCKGLMAYIPFKKNLSIGQNVTVTMKYIEDKFVIGVTKAQSKWGLSTICPGLSSIHLHCTGHTSNEEQCMDVDDDEESATEKIKRIVFDSNMKAKKEEIGEEVKTSMDEVELSKKAKKKKGVSNTEKIINEVDFSKKSVKKRKVKNDGNDTEMAMNLESGKKLNKKKCVMKKDDAKKDEDDSGVDESMDIADMELPKISMSCKPCLNVGTGFVWDIPENDGGEESDSSSNEEDEDLEAKKKKTKRLSRIEREILSKEEEKRLHELESARLEKERLPQTALDYEELLQQSPNSSAIWIQFISFHLENAEVDRARSVAQRALQLIDVQEFEERINIWTVVLRLEVLYGTEESTETAFREALATNDPLKIYIAMAMVYAESNKLKEAEDIYFKMSKKFSQTFDVWIKAGIFFYKNNKLEEARSYLDRALLSIDKTQHVNLINRFGQLEFQFGEVERARTVFESLLSNYPKRMDIWIVYVDLLAKRGDIEGARKVLERMTSLKLRLRNMRSVFKKFLEFEKIHGTPQSVESVKTRVQDYVAASLKEV